MGLLVKLCEKKSNASPGMLSLFLVFFSLLTWNEEMLAGGSVATL